MTDDLSKIWPNYLQGGYFDAAGDLKPEYVARSAMEPLIRAMAQGAAKLTTSQLRRFFQHCRSIEVRLRGQPGAWRQAEADFRKLDVAAADAYGKNPPKIPVLFHDFIQRNVQAVKSDRDFLHGFLPHFEALVGFAAPLRLSER